MNQYLIRLDDACPTMNREKWGRMEDLLGKYNIKPMVGVIPHNEDPKQQIDSVDANFWNKVHQWEDKGWAIALHGYNHCYSSDGGLKGLNPMWSRSEFAGLPLEEQRVKIKEGIAIMREHDVNPKYFFAPSHTFDENTLEALRSESYIRMISDTIGFRPYIFGDFTFIPQIAGHCVKIPLPGIYTFCFHPNTMSDNAFSRLEQFLQHNSHKFVSFSELQQGNYKEKTLMDELLSWLFFTIRKFRN